MASLDYVFGGLALAGTAVPVNQAAGVILGPDAEAVIAAMGGADAVPMSAVFVSRRARFEADLSAIKGEWGTEGLVSRQKGSLGIIKSIGQTKGVSRIDKRDAIGFPYELVAYETPHELQITCVLLGNADPEIGDSLTWLKRRVVYQVGQVGDTWAEGEFRVCQLTLWGGQGWASSSPKLGISTLG